MSEYFENLIMKSLQGNLTPAEKKELDTWLDQNENNRQTFMETEAVWQQTEKMLPPPVDSNAEWDLLEKRIDASVPARSSQRMILRIAAAISFVMLCSYILYISVKDNDLIVVASTTDTLSVQLPDGSHVTLNKDTRISYRENFIDDRSIDLFGEAFFDVQKDPAHPFVVHTRAADVKVLGTSFNIEAERNKITVLYVASGVVQMSAKDEKQSMEFRTGESGSFSIYDNQFFRNKAINPTAWKDRVLVFDNVRLVEVVESLDDYFDQDFLMEDHLADCRFTAEFRNPNLEEVIDVLREVFSLTVTREDKHILLSGDPCDQSP